MSAAVAVEAKRIPVGIGQLSVSADPLSVLVAYGLGSCVGVTAFDPVARIAGLVHVLLPESEGRAPDPREPARYADCAVDALVAQMTAAGAARPRLTIKLAGGAAVLGPANSEKFKIGERNAEAIRERLKRHGLRALAEDLGGVRGRTLELLVAGGRTTVRTAASPAREI